MREETSAAERLRQTRDKLCGLLEDSILYDAKSVLDAMAGSELWDEQVVLHSKVFAPQYNCSATHLSVTHVRSQHVQATYVVTVMGVTTVLDICQ